MCLARSPRRRRVVLALALLLAPVAPVLAQDTQYWSIQYGPVGQLLGGLVVGSTRDLSATYYNPGGLVLGKDPSFLLSVQAFKVESISLEPVDGGPFLDTAETTAGTFPGFVAGAFPAKWLGDKTRLAYSLLTRRQFNARFDARFAGPDPTGTGHYGLETLFDQRLRETWGGLTLSHRLSDRFGLGATLYGVYRSQRTRWEQSAQVAYPDQSGATALAIDDIKYHHSRALAKVGLAWEGQRARLGLTVTTPSAGLFGSGKAGQTRSATGTDLNGDGSSDDLLVNALDENLAADYESSWAIAGGAAWRRGSLQLHASAEWFAPVNSFDVLRSKDPASAGGPVALAGELSSVLNAGLGAEYWLGGVSADEGQTSRGTVLYGAYATDFSAAPRSGGGEPSSWDLDLHNVSAGAAFNVGRSRFSLGASYAFGSQTREIGLGGLPAGAPEIGEARPVRARYGRWVFVLGYLFGSGS